MGKKLDYEAIFMRKINICLFDKDQQFLDLFEKSLSALLNKFQVEHSIYKINTITELKLQKTKMDAFFIDIDFVNEEFLNNFDIMRDKRLFERIIVVSENVKQFKKAFRINARRFISKPINYVEIRETLLFLLSDINKDTRYEIKTDYSKVLVGADDISFIKSLGTHVKIVRSNRDEIVNWESAKSWEDRLDSRFVPCYRGIIVNVDHIRKKEGNNIYLYNGEVLPVSRRREKELVKKMNDDRYRF